MNFLVGIMLIYIKDEEKTFWAFTSLLFKKNWRMIYGDKTPKLISLLGLIEGKIHKEFPALLTHFKQNMINMAAAFSPLFISLYVYQIPLDIATRVFELFIVEGETILIKILFKMLSHKQQKLLSL